MTFKLHLLHILKWHLLFCLQDINNILYVCSPNYKMVWKIELLKPAHLTWPFN